MLILHDLLSKLKNEFEISRKSGERGIWFAYTLLAVIIPFTSSKTSNLLRCLKTLFGSDFEEYANKVPAFFPNFSTFTEPESYTVKPAVYRQHIFSALWFIWAVGILEVIEGLKDLGLLPSFWSVY